MEGKSILKDYTFELFAPYNAEAALIADFTNWRPVPMEKGPDGRFRVTRRLPDGDYRYKFNIRTKSWFYEPDEWKTVADPYATDVDQQTQNAVLRIRNGARIVDEYEWRHDDAPLPENTALVVYEMHVGDFSGGEADDFTRGTYADVVDKLDYLAALGVNALELMPLKESPGDFNWGYSPIHYFAPDSNYGPTEELKRLVDECHARGIRVVVDGVYNHANTGTPLAEIDHDYWFRREPKDPENSWGPEFDYHHTDENLGVRPAMRFVLDSIRHWIGEYHIDGIRFDAARQIDNFAALGEFVAEARAAAAMKPFFTVAEYIPPTPEVTEPRGPVESCWNDSFMYAMVEYLTGEGWDLEKIKDAVDARRLGYETGTSVTNYLANHDQNRLFRKLGEKGILGGEAYLRARLGALVLLTAVGVPMIWMGEEFGEHAPLSEASNKIDWTLLENPENRGLLDYYRSLVALRTTHPAFRAPNAAFFHEDAARGVLCYRRWDENGAEAIVALNLSDDDLEDYEIANFPGDGAWREWTKDRAVEARDGRLRLTLCRREGLVFVRN